MIHPSRRHTPAAARAQRGRDPARGARVALPFGAGREPHTPRSMRSTRSHPLVPALLAAAVLLGACDRSPTGVPGDRLVFIRAAADAPHLAATEVAFWAVKGDNREVEIRYVPLPGQSSGERCLRFRVDGDALLRRPDGSLIREGDSVRITIRVVDYQQFNFEFSPAGLRFDPRRPAELRVSYRFADRDFNADGVVDGRDEDFEFGFWRQERAGLPWTRTGSARIHDLEEVRAELDGFTRYALAGGH